VSLRWPKALAWFLAGIVGLGLFGWFVLLRPVAQPHVNDPIQEFNHGSIGNEERQGLPYWIWRVLPQMFPEYLPGDRDGYAAIGLYWVAGEELPVGLSKKTLGVIPRVAPNCAFCHQGSYRLYADDSPTLVPGGPGTRVNPQAYLRFLADAGQDARFNADAVMKEITAIYDMPWWERLLYRYLLIPLTKSALKKQGVLYAWTYERPDWGPGRIDPFNPVKYDNLKMGDDHTIGNSDMMPVWALDQALGDGSRIVAFHWDGLNTSLREVVVSGAVGDGMTYKSFPLVEERLARIETWARLQQPPPSPFSSLRSTGDPYYVESDRVEEGKALYVKYCAECHDPAGPRFRTVIPAIELGTDRHRIDMWSAEAARRYNAYESDYHWDFEAFQAKDGYIANELTGLWLKGPYLHNGSVPTLRDLLEPVDRRPVVFYRGWDLVDSENGGFVSRPGGEAERHGWRYNTRVPGNGNAGHLFGTELDADQKERLLTFLKTL
jgi:hypothetical protein